MFGNDEKIGSAEEDTVGDVLYHFSGMPWGLLKKLPNYDIHENERAQVSRDEFHRFCLPGAPKFQKYLRQQCGKGLKVFKPREPTMPFSEMQMRNGGLFHTPWKVWEVYNNGIPIGTYFVGPREKSVAGKVNYKRRYEGRIPGRINQGIVELNKENLLMDKYGDLYSLDPPLPEDTVTLHFGYHSLRFPQSCLTDITFQRFDEHLDIPFP